MAVPNGDTRKGHKVKVPGDHVGFEIQSESVTSMRRCSVPWRLSFVGEVGYDERVAVAFWPEMCDTELRRECAWLWRNVRLVRYGIERSGTDFEVEARGGLTR